MNPAWRKTQKGRIVYNEKRPSPFTNKDAARVLRSVLDFDTRYDKDEQVLRLLEFLFKFGFLGINIPTWKEDVENQDPPWFNLLESVIYEAAGKIGVPAPAQSFAKELGIALRKLVTPPVQRYIISDGFARLFVQAKEATKARKEGIEWRQ